MQGKKGIKKCKKKKIKEEKTYQMREGQFYSLVRVVEHRQGKIMVVGRIYSLVMVGVGHRPRKH
jgi:hypothetical protein